MSLAQNSGRSDLIPLWCQAPDNVRPPPPSPPPQSEAIPFEELEALDIIEKKKKKKKKKKHKKAHQESLGSPHAEGAGTVEKEKMAPPQEQAPLAPTEEDRLPISLTDQIAALGQQSFRLPEGWQNFNGEEFDMLIKDVLAGAGINKSGLPEGWTTVITRKKRKHIHTLPNVPEFLVGTMYNHPSVQEPEDEWEWELTIRARTHNLMSHDNFDVLEKLPPIPRNRMFPETVPQDVPDDDDDEEWTRIISTRIRNLQS